MYLSRLNSQMYVVVFNLLSMAPHYVPMSGADIFSQILRELLEYISSVTTLEKNVLLQSEVTDNRGSTQALIFYLDHLVNSNCQWSSENRNTGLQSILTSHRLWDALPVFMNFDDRRDGVNSASIDTVDPRESSNHTWSLQSKLVSVPSRGSYKYII